MRLKFCAACGATEDLQHHRLETRAEGGGGVERNLITLCPGCHAKLHERRSNGAYNHGARTKAALAAVKARSAARDEALRPVLAELAGMSANAIAVALNARKVPTPRGGSWSASTVIRVQRRLAR
jgi:hypothetical protein